MNTLVKTRRTQISPEPGGLRAWQTNVAARPGKRGMDVSRWFSSYPRERGRGKGTGKSRLTSWKCLKRRTPTSVGTQALSVSHSKFSFPTSVSTVPLFFLFALSRASTTPFLLPRREDEETFARESGSSRGARCRCSARTEEGPSPEAFPRREERSGCARPTRCAASMAQQTSDPFERIWPIKRGLRAALSSGLTQSTSFLSSRPPYLSPHPPYPPPRPPPIRRHPPGALCYSWLHPLPPPFAPSDPLDSPTSRRVLLPRQRPFQSMNSRQRAFRYFQKPVRAPIPPGRFEARWFSDRDFSRGCSIYSRQDTPSAAG